MKYIITTSQYNKAMDWYLTNAFEPHEEIHSKNNHGSISWVKNNEVIAKIEESTNIFWVTNHICSNFSDLFSLQFNQIQSVIKQWLEEHYELGELTPLCYWKGINLELEEHYKLG